MAVRARLIARKSSWRTLTRLVPARMPPSSKASWAASVPSGSSRLLRATFTEGLPIADKPTLACLATEVGLPAAQVRAVLDGDSYADAVRADEQQAPRYGITGVPFFVADGTYAVSGAQPPEVLLQLLRRAYDDTSQLTPVAVTTDSDSGTSCDGDCRVAG